MILISTEIDIVYSAQKAEFAKVFVIFSSIDNNNTRTSTCICITGRGCFCVGCVSVCVSFFGVLFCFAIIFVEVVAVVVLGLVILLGTFSNNIL